MAKGMVEINGSSQSKNIKYVFVFGFQCQNFWKVPKIWTGDDPPLLKLDAAHVYMFLCLWCLLSSSTHRFYYWGANLRIMTNSMYVWTNMLHIWTFQRLCRMLWYGLLADGTHHKENLTRILHTLLSLSSPAFNQRGKNYKPLQKYLIRLLVFNLLFMNTLVLWTRKRWAKEKVLCKEKLSTIYDAFQKQIYRSLAHSSKI